MLGQVGTRARRELALALSAGLGAALLEPALRAALREVVAGEGAEVAADGFEHGLVVVASPRARTDSGPGSRCHDERLGNRAEAMSAHRPTRTPPRWSHTTAPVKTSTTRTSWTAGSSTPSIALAANDVRSRCSFLNGGLGMHPLASRPLGEVHSPAPSNGCSLQYGPLFAELVGYPCTAAPRGPRSV